MQPVKTKETLNIKSFIKSLKDNNIHIEVRNKREIEGSHRGRLSQILTQLFSLLCECEYMDFIIIFDLNETRISWYSKNDIAVVVNLNFDPNTSTFKEALQKEIEKAL